MELTPNLGLKKPANSDFVSVEAFNENSDILDELVASLEYDYIEASTTDTTNGNTINWMIWKYRDGRVVMKSKPTPYSLPITTGWTSGWFRSDKSLSWVFPLTLVSVQTPAVSVVRTNQLLLYGAPMHTSVLNLSQYRSDIYVAAPDSKTASVQFVCEVEGRWK